MGRPVLAIRADGARVSWLEPVLTVTKGIAPRSGAVNLNFRQNLIAWFCVPEAYLGRNLVMKATTMLAPRLNRRGFLQVGAIGTAALGLGHQPLAEVPRSDRGVVRDRFWVFTCAANSDFPHLGRRSVMTPAEGAFYLGVPNIIMVQSSESEARYGRFELPFAQYTIALRPLRRVVWSVVGSGGFQSPTETKEVLELARTGSNFAGIMLDDFFTGQNEGKRAQLTLDELAGIRRQFKEIGKHLDIFVTLYARHLDLPLRDYLDLVDVITLWTSDPADLVRLEANLTKVETLAPKARKMQGCYLVDYGQKQGTPVPLMQLQCETGLRWLRQRRIEGMIFLGNTTMDLGFASVEWTRQWIQKVGNTKLAQGFDMNRPHQAGADDASPK